MAQLQVGDKAPAFTLSTSTARRCKLSSFKGKRVVVYFYPKADTPGCTTQSCDLRDAKPELKKLEGDVVGISPDPPTKQKKFDDKYELGFPLLADKDHEVAEAWGVWGEKSMYGRKFMGIIRSAFVVDEKGKIAGAFYKVSPKDTVPKVQRCSADSRGLVPRPATAPHLAAVVSQRVSDASVAAGRPGGARGRRDEVAGDDDPVRGAVEDPVDRLEGLARLERGSRREAQLGRADTGEGVPEDLRRDRVPDRQQPGPDSWLTRIPVITAALPAGGV